MKLKLKYIILSMVAYVGIASVVYLTASLAYARELDLYVYFNELNEGNFFNPNWSLDLGFSGLLYLLSPLASSPQMLSIFIMLMIFSMALYCFRGDRGILKASLFCLSYPVLLGSVNQIRATLFMVTFLLALNSGKSYRLVKLLFAGSMHVYSFLLFALIAIGKLSKFWIITLATAFVMLISQFGDLIFHDLIIGLSGVWTSYENIEINLTTIVLKACVLGIFLIGLKDRFDVLVILVVSIFFLIIGMYSVLDRFFTLSLIFVFFNFLKYISSNSYSSLKYILFILLNTTMLANSSLLWPH